MFSFRELCFARQLMPKLINYQKGINSREGSHSSYMITWFHETATVTAKDLQRTNYLLSCEGWQSIRCLDSTTVDASCLLSLEW